MFNRPPRTPVPLPSGTVRIPDLPDLPSKPGNTNWITLLVTAGVTFLGGLLLAAIQKNTMYLFMLVFSVGSLVASVISSITGKRKYRSDLAAALAAYDDELAELEAELAALQNRERKLLTEMDPTLDECLRRAAIRDGRHLGERRPKDPDFLGFRIGTGRVESGTKIETPELKKPAPELKTRVERVRRMLRQYASIDGAPITIKLRESGHLGIVGHEVPVSGFTRALLCQLSTHHWPSDIEVAVICEPGQATNWQWVSYLPNPWERLAIGEITHPRPGTLGTNVAKTLEEEIDWRRNTRSGDPDAEESSKGQDILPKLVIVFDHISEPLSYPAIQKLLDDRQGDLGVYGLFLEDRADLVPGNCSAVLKLHTSGAGMPRQVEYIRSVPVGVPLIATPDPLCDYQQAETLARALSGVDWLRVDRVGGPPAQVSFLELFGARDLSQLLVESWWESDGPFGYLRVPIGQTSPTSNLWFDLNDRDDAHGPHGLIGGTTGSGKSEVLKTVALALALTHHPYEVNFAFIDFKGGAAFNELRNLPHTVGVMTDIETHASYCLRMLQALTGEIEQRKRIIENAHARFGLARSHIDDYRTLEVREPLPRLIIVFDEFASFKERYPEESKALINIARQGRSLGVHLILSTQTLSTSIDENIRQNSRFRILLKVASDADSREIIGTPAAHQIQRRGRGYFYVSAPVEFQAAYAGAPYSPAVEGTALADAIVRRWPDGRTEVLNSMEDGDQQAATSGAGRPQTEAQAIIEHLQGLADRFDLRLSRRIWPDPLPETLFLPTLVASEQKGGWTGQGWIPVEEPFAPILGMYDYPLKQQQPIYRFETAKGDGHLLVFGQPGSGKSSLLHALVVGLAMAHSPHEVCIYVLDFGGQASMRLIEGFPQVGSVITRNETERIDRLFQQASSAIAARGELFRQAGVNDFSSYNAKAEPSLRLPAIFILIDGFGSFKRTFAAESPVLYQQPAGLLNGGRAAGVHLVITANQWSDVDDKISGNLNSMLTFKVSSSAELHNIVGSTGGMETRTEIGVSTPPGRGFLRGNPVLEFQAALPTEGDTDEDRLGRLNLMIEQMRAACKENGIAAAPSVNSLPTTVTLEHVRRQWARGARDHDASPLGLDYESLEPTGLSFRRDGPGFIVSGAVPQAGKSTLLTSWLLSETLTQTTAELKLVIIGFHSRSLAPLAALPHVLRYVGLSSEMSEVLPVLKSEVERSQEALERAYGRDPLGFDENQFLRTLPLLVVVIDDYDAFTLRCESRDLDQIGSFLARGGNLGARVLLADDVPQLASRPFTDSLWKRIKTYGCGIQLGGVNGLDQVFSNARLAPELRRSTLPLGRGFIVNRGMTRLFQAAQYWDATETPRTAVTRYVQFLQDKNCESDSA